MNNRNGGGCLILLLCCLIYAGCKDKVTNITAPPISPPVGAAFSAVSGKISFFDLQTNEIRTDVDFNGSISSAEFALTGTALYLANTYTGMISVHTLPNMAEAERLETGGIPIDLRLNTTATKIFLINNNGNFRRYGRDDTNVDTLGVGLEPRRLAVKPPEEMQVWIACRGDFSVYVIDLHSFTIADTLHFNTAPSDICFSQGGQVAYVALQGSQGIARFSTESREELGTRLDAGPGPIDLALNHNGMMLVASDSTLGEARFWNFESDASWTMKDIFVGNSAGRARFSHNNKCYVMSRHTDRVVCIDVNRPEPEIIDIIQMPAEVTEIALWESP